MSNGKITGEELERMRVNHYTGITAIRVNIIHSSIFDCPTTYHKTHNVLRHITKYITWERKLLEREDTRTCQQRTDYNNYTHN